MKKFFALLCIMAIAGAFYVGIIAPSQGREVTLETIEAEAGDFVEQAQDLYEEYGTEVVEEANDAINGAVGEANNAINEAVESAVEGAADGFWESLKQSVTDFFDQLNPF